MVVCASASTCTAAVLHGAADSSLAGAIMLVPMLYMESQVIR